MSKPQSKRNHRGLAVLTLAGLFVAVACGADDDDAGDQPAAGSAGKAGSNATAGTSSNAGSKATGGTANSAGAGGTPSPPHGGGPVDCNDHHSVASCEAAGCIAETGTLSERLGEGGAGGDGGASNGGAPGAGGTLNRGACTRKEDVFIACEDGSGGQPVNYRCSQDCRACIEGGGRLPQFPGFPRQDCVFTCVDGEVQP